MSDFELKINGLNWLKAMNIGYYCSNDDEHANVRAHILAQQNNKLSDSLSEVLSNKANEINKSTIMQQNFTTNENPIITRARNLADNANTIEELKAAVINFDGCELKKMAQNTVFADGNPGGSFMFVGEAPGATEDKMGIPFCGESGKLLDNLLASISVSRSINAYITNTVFWRPPANRVPTQEEIDICRPFVEKHIALINPKIIILVGSVAATSLLGKHAGITKIRQEYYSYSNKYLLTPIPTTAIFHPAYLLRQPMQKKTTWYDLLKIEHYVQENEIL